MTNKGKIVTICRKTGPSHRGSVMRDFFYIIKGQELYSEEYHNKTNKEYYLMGNTVEFISLDEPSKVRGRKRDLLFVNECSELSKEDFFQLNIRTNDRVIIDYNPSMEFHWIYTDLMPREDADFFQTTYLDNPFLDQSLIDEIEKLKYTDDNYWRIYGLGERGMARSLVFNFFIVDDIPKDAKKIGIGLDFGFSNDETAMVETWVKGDDMYCKELLYRTGMTNSDIVQEFKRLNIDRRDEIWADSAEPKSIEEIFRMGYNCKPTYKGAINLGIDMIRRYRLHATKDSLNLIKELRNYKYVEDKNGNVTNKPQDLNNHTCDALRYSIVNRLSRPNYGTYAIR